MSTFPFDLIEIYEVDVWIVFIAMYNDNSYILSSCVDDINVICSQGTVCCCTLHYFINNSVQQEYFCHIVQYLTVIEDKVNN